MNPLKAWNQFLFGPISARPIAAFRVAYGFLMVVYLLLMTADFDLYYTSQGLFTGEQARQSAGNMRFSLLQYTDNVTVAHAVHWATLAVAVGFMLGWHTRIMSVLLYAGMLTIYHRSVISNGGPDAMPAILSFYAMLLPCGKAYSLDAKREARKRGTVAEALVSPWSIRLLQMQICLLYFQSCVIKCQGAAWLEGTTVHYVVHNREFGLFDLEWLGAYPLVINAMTHSALLIEFALAFWLWFRPTRRWAILGGVLLHLGIRPVINVPGFGEMMIATYIAFLAPDEVSAILHALDPRRLLAAVGLQIRVASQGGTTPAPRPAWQQLEIPFEVEVGRVGDSPVTA